MPPRHGRFAHQRVPIAATSRFFPGSLELLCRIKPRQAKCCLEMALLVSHFNFIFISDSTEALCYTRESQLERIQFLLRLWDLFQAECIAMRPDNSTEKRPSVAVGGCILSVWQWMTPVAACVKSTNEGIPSKEKQRISKKQRLPNTLAFSTQQRPYQCSVS